jgi:hypothetical protein
MGCKPHSPSLVWPLRTRMKNPMTWLQGKFTESCSCASGRRYRECCYRREVTYFLIFVLSALVLFGAPESPAFLIALPVLLQAAFAAKARYDRERRQHHKHDDLL